MANATCSCSQPLNTPRTLIPLTWGHPPLPQPQCRLPPTRIRLLRRLNNIVDMSMPTLLTVTHLKYVKLVHTQTLGDLFFFQHMMPGMAPPGPPYMPGPYMQPMPYPPGMPPPNGVFCSLFPFFSFYHHSAHEILNSDVFTCHGTNASYVFFQSILIIFLSYLSTLLIIAQPLERTCNLLHQALTHRHLTVLGLDPPCRRHLSRRTRIHITIKALNVCRYRIKTLQVFYSFIL